MRRALPPQAQLRLLNSYSGYAKDKGTEGKEGTGGFFEMKRDEYVEVKFFWPRLRKSHAELLLTWFNWILPAGEQSNSGKSRAKHAKEVLTKKKDAWDKRAFGEVTTVTV